MCCAVLEASSIAYWAKMGIGYFPTSVKDICKELPLLEPMYQCTQMVQENIKKKNAERKAKAYAKTGKQTPAMSSVSKAKVSFGDIP
jgi:hypothetical protein